ncbi:ABC transporter ATP-binding protein [Candidatus Gracilibacteria bacterium]|nr:ABC transporter ATP-binding protein [Candidatus Gracilibacteria bacterium]
MSKKSLALSIKNLKKTYPKGTEALKGVSFDIEKGDFFALLGPNGAGKSTTIGIISGLINKSSGEVIIAGHNLDTAGAEARLGVGVVPQEFNFGIFEKVYDIVLSQAGYYGISPEKAKPNVEKYLKALGLWEKKDAASRTLSGGMKRRLMIARALVHNPQVLILDEPTAGVDLELRHGMYEFLRELNASGVTIILTTHYLEEAESLCRNIAIIDRGTIVRYGPIKELLSSMEDEVISVDLDKNYTGKNLDEYSPVISEQILDLTVSSKYTLDAALQILQKEDYKIRSIKPKSGRLEEFFLKSTGN